MLTLAGFAIGLISVVYYRRRRIWQQPKNDHYIGNRFAEEERAMQRFYDKGK